MLGRSLATIVVLALALGACSSSTHYSPGPLTNSTSCGVLNADQAAGDTADIDNYLAAANPYLAAESLQASLLGECRTQPAELLSAAYNKASAAYNKAQDAFLSRTPTPTPTPDVCAEHGGEPAYAWCGSSGAPVPGNDVTECVALGYCTPSATPPATP